MLNLIKSEGYKLCKLRSFKILVVVMIACTIIASMVMWIENPKRKIDDIRQEEMIEEEVAKECKVIMEKYSMDEEEAYRFILESGDGIPTNGEEMIIMGVANVCAAFIVFAILAGLFISTEFKSGSLKISVAFGNSRKKLYIAKMLVYYLGGLILGWIFPILGGIIISFVCGWGRPLSGECLLYLFRLLVLGSLLHISALTVFGATAIATKHIGATIGVGIALGSLCELLYSFIGLSLFSGMKWQQYFWLAQYNILLRENITWAQLIGIVAWGVLVTLVAFIVGLRLFEKAEFE